MKVQFLHEPELEFGTGRHVDIRFGLMHHGPLDQLSPVCPRQIRIGIVGTAETVEGVEKWLERCSKGIEAKKSNQPNLFPRFPGFGEGTRLHAPILTDSQLQRVIRSGDVDILCKTRKINEVISVAVEMFFEELERILEKGTADVFICALPMSLVKFIYQGVIPGVEGVERADDSKNIDFHDMLKAKALKLGKPVQIVLPMTYDDRKRLAQRGRHQTVRRLQDEATRAWNIYTALYYKAGGTPWRIPSDPYQLTTCYIGVSFYKALEGTRLLTSTAQVFNERGIGIILRGGSATLSKEDRLVHLEEAQAFNLMSDALKAYKAEHHNLPARVVVHKTSPFDIQELGGFRGAIKSEDVDSTDFISVRNSSTRLFRYGPYPPLRGTFLNLDESVHVLYTRGSVDFFSTYPGLYVPRPLEFRCAQVEQTPTFLSEEILALTKMNWNSTQFDNDEPITVKAARNVGNILKYVGQAEVVQPRYSFYM